MLIQRKERKAKLFPGRFLGIEITEHEIRMSEVKLRRKHEAQVFRCWRYPLPVGLMNEGQFADRSKMIHHLKKAIALSETSARRMHFVLPPALYRAQMITLPAVSKRKFSKLLAFEMKHRLQVSFDDPYYDYMAWKVSGTSQAPAAALAPSLEQPTPSPIANYETKLDSGRYEVLLVSVSKRQVASYVNLFKASGLKPLSFEIKALSLHRLLNHSNLLREELVQLIVDAKNDAVDFHIYQGAILKLTRHVLLDIEEREESDLWYIEQLEREIERLLRYYHYHMNYRQKQVTRILALGDVWNDNILTELQNRLMLPIQMPSPSHMELELKQFDRELSSFAVTIGLALRGVSK